MQSTDRRQAENAGAPLAPLAGLRVVALSNTLAGAQASLFLADYGAEVVQVEPPGGSPLRAEPGYPFFGRGKQSIELDLKNDVDLDVALELASRADVLIETFRPGVADRLGLGYEALSARNPRLVYCSITGFGRSGPYAATKGYEGLVMAKVGAFGAFGPMVARPGPAFSAVPYATFGAAQSGLQAILAALLDREDSGLGQYVESTLAQGIAAQDPCYWYLYVIASRFPDAFMSVPSITDDGLPNSDIALRGLVALTADGHWLQFSQVLPHLYQPFMRALGLDWMFDDPEWSTAPNFDDMDKRLSCWEQMLSAARTKTLAEWREIFEADRNIWAELFREGPELLDHPQMLHNEQVVEIDDAERGTVRQPNRMISLAHQPALRRAPMRDEQAAQIRAAISGVGAGATSEHRASTEPAPGRLPLAGVTVLELGAFFAAPYGATILTDLGARVIKIEPLAGDPMRNLLAFPETAGAKVLQGKDSVAVDISTTEGRQIVLDVAARADLVVQSYRAGVAQRLGLDAEALHAVNPDLVYLNAPGYGIDGPCGDRPSFGMTIGAATLALRNLGPAVKKGPDLTMDEVKAQSMRLWCAASVGIANCDGLSGLAVATALLLGLYSRRRGAPGHTMFTNMLGIGAHAMAEDAVQYAGRAPACTPDPDLYGYHALYRLYETADGWIFLAAPAPAEWPTLVTALSDTVDLGDDHRFSSAAERRTNDSALGEVLDKVFRTLTALEWERRLGAADVGCVVAEPAPAEAVLMSEKFGRASGFVADVVHPTFDEVPRLAPLFRFSRSQTVARAGCTLGQHTTDVLHELGYPDDVVVDLHKRGIVAG